MIRIRQGLRPFERLFGRAGKPAKTKPKMTPDQRAFRYIWHYLTVGSDRRNPLSLGQQNVLILQMGKVASHSIQTALSEHGINAFHSHGLSDPAQLGVLSRLLERDVTFRLVAHDLRRHIQNVAMQMMVRWYERHKHHRGRKLKVITLTRDPVTHYPSSFLHRRDIAKPGIMAWERARSGLPPEHPVDEAQAMLNLVMEAASIIAEGRPSADAAGHSRCIAVARERWPEHPVIASEVGGWLTPQHWFDGEITAIFGVDMLAAPELRERGWAARSNDWVDVLVVKFEELKLLLPDVSRFFGVGALTLPPPQPSSAKEGAAEVMTAVRLMLETPIGQACARELRTSRYGLACGYDRLG
jgi:hypothetical protein